MPTAFGVLGPLVVRDASGAAVPLGGQKARELLAVLLLHRGQILFVDTLVGKLWGDEPSTGAATTLRTYVGRVRRILEGAGAAAALQNRSGGYCLEVDPDDLDAERFESSLRLGQEAAARGEAEEADASADPAHDSRPSTTPAGASVLRRSWPTARARHGRRSRRGGTSLRGRRCSCC